MELIASTQSRRVHEDKSILDRSGTARIATLQLEFYAHPNQVAVKFVTSLADGT